MFVLIHPTHWLISTQATAAFVRGISAHIARRKEAATLLPGAMAYLLDKVRTKPNKHTGCKMCPVRKSEIATPSSRYHEDGDVHAGPVCKRDFEDDSEAQKTIDRLDKVVKKHQQGVGAAFGDLTTSCAEIQGELDALEPQWRAWVATLQKKVLAEKDVDEKRAAASQASDAAKDAANSFERCGSMSVKASSHYDKACHLADLGASLRDAVHARDAKKETLDRVAQDAGTGGRRSRRDITRDLKRLQDEKEAAVNKRAQVSGLRDRESADGRTPYATPRRTTQIRER